jgi:hypothetical protein
MSDVVGKLRDHLIARGLVRDPGAAGPGARPWLPPVWRHPEDGAIGPGDAADQGKATAADDGLVVSLMWAPGIPPGPGEEERRIFGDTVVLRGQAVPAIVALENAIRNELVGTDPGGRCDWTMAGLYVVQSREYRPFQPTDTEDGTFTFSTGFIFEVRA